jgi:hypothetical protein
LKTTKKSALLSKSKNPSSKTPCKKKSANYEPHTTSSTISSATPKKAEPSAMRHALVTTPRTPTPPP